LEVWGGLWYKVLAAKYGEVWGTGRGCKGVVLVENLCDIQQGVGEL